jgi:AAHS family 4-hydroxybenzoate transporter-like MFS transporter
VGRWGRYQQALVALAALTIIFDGADIQLLGVAIPAMMADWAIARGAFAPVLATGLVGMMIGGAIGGIAGDRFGRRVALIGSLLVFGVLTLAVAAIDNLVALGVLRFCAGLGFGATVPNAAALVSEYVPARHRPLAVTLTIVCVPIGGTLAAIVAGFVLPAYGWRTLFAIGGLMPIVVAVIMFAALPESPRFLARHPARWPELTRLLRRFGHDIAPGAAFVEPERTVGRASLVALFAAEFRRDTLALWGAFACCLLAVYAGFNWVPAMLTGAGLDVGVASAGIAAFNLGGVVGALAGALLITRFGSRATIVGMAIAAVASAGVMMTMRVAADANPFPIVLLLGITGGLINAVQTTMYALAAHLYPTAMRATGVGSAASVGRLGAVASTYAGAWTLEAGGPRLFFGLIAAAMATAAASLAVVRRHIPRT